MRVTSCWILSIAIVATGCGGSAPPPEEPEVMEPEPEAEPEPVANPEPEAEPESEAEAAPADVADPEFKEGMSVADAQKVVPQGIPRMNVELERLSTPLQDFAVYEPCKPSASQHFNLKVAIWRGKAVGIDVASTPKNAKLEECVKERIGQIEWPDKVPSLNTVEYAF